jgi:hypothetical protein
MWTWRELEEWCSDWKRPTARLMAGAATVGPVIHPRREQPHLPENHAHEVPADGTRQFNYARGTATPDESVIVFTIRRAP